MLMLVFLAKKESCGLLEGRYGWNLLKLLFCERALEKESLAEDLLESWLLRRACFHSDDLRSIIGL